MNTPLQIGVVLLKDDDQILRIEIDQASRECKRVFLLGQPTTSYVRVKRDRLLPQALQLIRIGNKP